MLFEKYKDNYWFAIPDVNRLLLTKPPPQVIEEPEAIYVKLLDKIELLKDARFVFTLCIF